VLLPTFLMAMIAGRRQARERQGIWASDVVGWMVDV